MATFQFASMSEDLHVDAVVPISIPGLSAPLPLHVRGDLSISCQVQMTFSAVDVKDITPAKWDPPGQKLIDTAKSLYDSSTGAFGSAMAWGEEAFKSAVVSAVGGSNDERGTWDKGFNLSITWSWGQPFPKASPRYVGPLLPGWNGKALGDPRPHEWHGAGDGSWNGDDKVGNGDKWSAKSWNKSAFIAAVEKFLYKSASISGMSANASLGGALTIDFEAAARHLFEATLLDPREYWNKLTSPSYADQVKDHLASAVEVKLQALRDRVFAARFDWTYTLPNGQAVSYWSSLPAGAAQALTTSFEQALDLAMGTGKTVVLAALKGDVPAVRAALQGALRAVAGGYVQGLGAELQRLASGDLPFFRYGVVLLLVFGGGATSPLDVLGVLGTQLQQHGGDAALRTWLLDATRWVLELLRELGRLNADLLREGLKRVLVALSPHWDSARTAVEPFVADVLDLAVERGPLAPFAHGLAQALGPALAAGRSA